MLVVDADGALTDSRVSDLPDFLRAGDALVVNDTRVIAARLEGVRVRGDAAAAIEATLIRRVDDCRWRALVRPAKKLRVGERIRFGETRESRVCLLAALDAEVEEKGDAGEVLLRFEFAGAALDEAIERLGAPPLPPYIAARRATGEKDRADYQTMFAAEPGAVAAPTAGLHFTPVLVERIAARGVSLHRVTLHVGAGTFLPVKVEDTRDHAMHAEEGAVDAATAAALNTARQNGGRIVCVGTTSARLLESAADEEGRIHSFAGETVDLHHPRLPLPRGRRADDQFPSAALHACHAGERLQRARCDPQGLCARDRSGLSLLLLRRRVPADRGARERWDHLMEGRLIDSRLLTIEAPLRPPGAMVPVQASVEPQPVPRRPCPAAPSRRSRTQGREAAAVPLPHRECASPRSAR